MTVSWIIPFVIFLMGMAKGGFPVGAIALPLLVLIWPSEMGEARDAIGFMLPILCVMDIFAVVLYRRHILWKRLVTLFPGMLVGVLTAGLLFVAEASPISVSDRALKLTIGCVGISFVVLQACRTWLLKRVQAYGSGGWVQGTFFGFVSGVVSTIAHAAGPLMQIYLLPQKLKKLNFAGTMAGFFFVLNLVKLAPFIYCNRITADGLKLGLRCMWVVPLGVGLGYVLVRLIARKYYIALIYAALFVTSLSLILQNF